MKIRVDEDAVVPLLRELVSIESVNPNFGGGSGEAAVARRVAAFLEEIGIQPELQEVAPGRFNVLGRLGPTRVNGKASGALAPGSGAGSGTAGRLPRLLWQTHLDTVQVTGMTIDPFAGIVQDGRLYGRGACDAKGQVVAMLLALKALAPYREELPCEIIFAACCDEEFHFIGVRHLVEQGIHADAAIVGEPTRMEIVVAHKGFLRFEVETLGKAAHSSTPERGANAIEAMAEVIRYLRDEEVPTYEQKRHPLVGPPTLCVSLIQGGAGINTVPDRCKIGIDRRLVPGEEPDEVWQGLKERLEGLFPMDSPLTVRVHEPFLKDWAMETPENAPVLEPLRGAIEAVLGRPAVTVGVPYGTDASKLARAGIPSVVFGPGDIAQAHSKDEWVEIAEVATAATVLIATAQMFGKTDGKGTSSQ